MKSVSIYTKDLNFDPSSYYRIVQYTSKLKNCKIFYHPQLSKEQYLKYMPISRQNILVKVYLQVLIMMKMFIALIKDLITKVDVVLISRRIINRCFPIVFKIILIKIKKNGAKIYWDFDDHILESKETSKGSFDFFCKISDKIVVTHEFLKELVLEEARNKVVLLPTTDGDIYIKYNESIYSDRIKSVKNEIRLLWVGTSVNLVYLTPLITVLDKFASNFDKKIMLNIVCNEAVDVEINNIQINNIKWTREVAISTMLYSHIGLMPLIDSNFAKGKGGFKLVQYLSAALPIIGSDVGFNKEVCDDTVGKLVDDIYDYEHLCESLNYVINNWEVLSRNALAKWNKDFSYNNNFLFWEECILR